MQETKHEKRPTTRRRLLKALATGGGVAITAKSVPNHWTRPAVDAVVLPGHAQATTCIDSGDVTAEIIDDDIVSISFDFGFGVFDPVPLLANDSFDTDLPVPDGCTGSGNISGTIVGKPPTMTGTIVSSFTCSDGPSCTDFELEFTATAEPGQPFFNGSWTASGSIGCCEYLVPLDPV